MHHSSSVCVFESVSVKIILNLLTTLEGHIETFTHSAPTIVQYENAMAKMKLSCQK